MLDHIMIVCFMFLPPGGVAGGTGSVSRGTDLIF